MPAAALEKAGDRGYNVYGGFFLIRCLIALKELIKNEKGGFGKNKPVLITIVALVVLAAMILASAGRGTANWFENAVGAVLTPVQGFAARASNSIADFSAEFLTRPMRIRRTQNSKASLHSITKCSWNLRSLKRERAAARPFGILRFVRRVFGCCGIRHGEVNGYLFSGFHR